MYTWYWTDRFAINPFANVSQSVFKRLNISLGIMSTEFNQSVRICWLIIGLKMKTLPSRLTFWRSAAWVKSFRDAFPPRAKRWSQSVHMNGFIPWRIKTVSPQCSFSCFLQQFGGHASPMMKFSYGTEDSDWNHHGMNKFHTCIMFNNTNIKI